MNSINLQDPLNAARGLLHQSGTLPGDYEKVEKSLGDYLARNPDNREARLLRGIALGRLGRLPEGEAAFDALLKEAPQDPVVLNDLGVIWLLKGKLQDALGAFSDAIELDPTRAEFQYNLGEAHKRLGKLDAASMAYARAAELDPDFEAAYNNLGLALFKLGKPQKALAFLSQILERNPSNTKIQKNQAAVRQAQDTGKTAAPLEEYTDPLFVFFDRAPKVPEAAAPGGSDGKSVLELLRFLRLLTGALPPKALEFYSRSDTRLTMEFIIGALEGHTGLLRELQEKGRVPSPGGPAKPASTERASTEPEAAKRVSADTDLADTLDYIRGLAASLAEGDISAVLNRKVEGIISKMQRAQS
jgi:tetratricopeptide (TPR) repeat protein